MKTFIVLDDVNRLEQLEYLVGEFNQYNSESRIIITTRDKNVLNDFGVDKIYEVEKLNNNASIQLFSNYAFRKSPCF